MKRLFSWLLIFGLGTWFGAWLFRDVQPRAWLPVHGATLRSSSAELLGYLGSAAMQHAPGLVPGVVLETDKSIAPLPAFPPGLEGCRHGAARHPSRALTAPSSGTRSSGAGAGRRS